MMILTVFLQIMNEFSSKLFIHFNTEMTEALTITRLALNIFFKKFYPNKVIPLINNYSYLILLKKVIMEEYGSL